MPFTGQGDIGTGQWADLLPRRGELGDAGSQTKSRRLPFKVSQLHEIFRQISKEDNKENSFVDVYQKVVRRFKLDNKSGRVEALTKGALDSLQLHGPLSHINHLWPLYVYHANSMRR